MRRKKSGIKHIDTGVNVSACYDFRQVVAEIWYSQESELQTEHQSAAALVLSCAALLSGQHPGTALQTALAYPALADFAKGLDTELSTELALSALSEEQGAAPLSALLYQGSARLQPLLSVAAARLAQGQPTEYLCFASACWLRYSMGFDGKGDTLVVEDALADLLMQNRLERWDHIDELMAGYLAIDTLFPKALAAEPVFADRLSYWLCVILANGMVTALQILSIECRDYSARDFSTFATNQRTPA